MFRDRLRKEGPRLFDEVTLRGFEALILENRWLRVTLLPKKGSDVVEFLYKPLDIDVLWRAPSGFWTQEKLYPADLTTRGSFIDYYPGGWQEILPNGGPACEYRGAHFDEHGETPLLPWSWHLIEDSPTRVAVRLATRCLRTPFTVEKTFSLGAGPVLFIDEAVSNIGAEPVDLMWGHHPALGVPFVDDTCIIDVPAHTCRAHDVERFASQRLDPGQAFTWPHTVSRDGATLDFSRVQPPGAGTADLLYLTDLDDGWFAVTNQSKALSFGMAWTREIFPHLWYWHDANGTPGYPWYSGSYLLALEPWSSHPGLGLAEAVARGMQLTLQPGERRTAQLTAAFGTGLRRVQRVTLDGTMLGREENPS
jgi:hypothetical protein